MMKKNNVITMRAAAWSELLSAVLFLHLRKISENYGVFKRKVTRIIETGFCGNRLEYLKRILNRCMAKICDITARSKPESHFSLP